MDTIQRVRELANERNLTLSKLAELCNLPQSTIKNTARRKGQLSVETLEQICRGLVSHGLSSLQKKTNRECK